MSASPNSSPLLTKRHRAQALVEFTLVLPVMLLMTLGLIDLGRAFVFGVTVQEGTRQAVRLAAATNIDYANKALTISNSDLLGRLVSGSSPALNGCSATAGTQSCNGANWTFTVNVVGVSGTAYPSIELARAANDLTGTPTAAAQVTVTAAGNVALLPGVNTGNFGLTLPQIHVQGQSSMAVL